MNGIDRRAFLRTAAVLLATPALGTGACTRGRFTTDPFTLGVASGAPLPDAVVLWTRLAPAPLTGGGLDPVAIAVHWEVAADEMFRTIVRRGTADAEPQFAHSVHVEVDGLSPDRWYWYRFRAGDAISPVGRTRTAPAPGTLGTWRFAFASCQQYEQGYYAAHRHMAQEELDLVVFLGDYIYESSWGRAHVRKHEGPQPYTLEQYRNRYARYKSDPDLQRCHARFPWIVTWDDHEVSNDYAADRSQDRDPHFLARRSAAYQAYYEHMPLRTAARPQGAQLQLYGHYDFGRLARFYVLDGRQHRSYQACQPADRGGSRTVEECAERFDDRRSLLGAAQEAWLRDSFERSGARWNVIAQQTLMAPLNRGSAARPAFWTDGWDGYPAARARLLGDLVRARVQNPIVIGGDVHANLVCDLKADFDARSPVIATEFCGTSITSQGQSQARYDARRALSPHVKFARSDRRGYVAVTLDEHHGRVRLQVIEDEKRQSTPLSLQASFVVQNGRPGAEPA